MNEQRGITFIHPSQAFDELATLAHRGNTLPHIMARVAELARLAIPGATEASVTLLKDQYACTAAGSGARALAFDERQYEAGQGPCLEAAWANIVIRIDETATEQRWTDYMQMLFNHGVRSVLSVPMARKAIPVGALNIYSNIPGMFGESNVELSRTVAEYVWEVLSAVNVLANPDMRMATEWKAVSIAS